MSTHAWVMLAILFVMFPFGVGAIPDLACLHGHPDGSHDLAAGFL
jgi:hypothetical protein